MKNGVTVFETELRPITGIRGIPHDIIRHIAQVPDFLQVDNRAAVRHLAPVCTQLSVRISDAIKGHVKMRMPEAVLRGPLDMRKPHTALDVLAEIFAQTQIAKVSIEAANLESQFSVAVLEGERSNSWSVPSCHAL
jgi:hypothetical protein